MHAYQFRLYPNKEQGLKLLWAKDVCCLIYNRLLELYNDGERDIAKLQALLPVWKKSDEDLREEYSTVLRYELYRLLTNFAALREMKKVRSELSDLMLVDRRPPIHQKMKQVDWMKQEVPSARTG